jgi:outer membrane biogenesis lipoprotein LolB
MKKIIAILLIIMGLFVLGACTASTSPEVLDDDNSQLQPSQEADRDTGKGIPAPPGFPEG